MKQNNIIKEIWAVAGYFLLQTAVNLAVSAAATLYYTAGLDMEGMSAQAIADAVYSFALRINNILMIITNVLLLVIIFIIARRKKTTFAAHTGLDKKMASGKIALLCGVAGLAGGMWTNFLLNSGIVPTDVMDNYGQSSQVLYEGPVWAMIVSVVILSPIVEEIIFRGLIMGHMRNILPVGAAIVLQGIMFGSVHAADPLWITIAAFFGCVIGFVCVRTGSLRGAIVFHVLYNASSFVFLPLADAIWENELAKGAVFVASAAVFLLAVGLLDRHRREAC